MAALGSILPIGTIIHSMLTTSQFASEYGDNWVLADGRSVTGTKYALVTGNTTIPDMRGAFLRAKGSTYNPDGDLALGTYSADKFASHTHSIGQTLSTTPASGGNGFAGGDYALQTGMGASGSNETAPKSITVNVFIRIN
jgi:hypothetical protein